MTEIEAACPFCGEKYEITERVIRPWRRDIPIIECASCGAILTMRRILRRSASATASEELIKLWNNRP
jgi:uncharacterized Zn finger protein